MGFMHISMKMSPASSSSSRWCPTPEQLMILEEMYRSGVRTPKASQIQHITAHLSFYGKIEGKNVFYWFQNHKARERQKLRRMLGKQLQHQPNHLLLHYFDNPSLSLSLQQSNSNSPIIFLPQGGGVSGETRNYTWKLDMPEKEDKYGRDWMTMVDVAPASRPPSKTLQLFPINATGNPRENANAPQHYNY